MTEVPYVQMFEKEALRLLERGGETAEQLKEALNRYANRYAEEHSSRA